MGDVALSLLMLVALALVAGAVIQWRRNGPSRNVWLMLVAALVMLANVAIWAIPDRHGTSPLNHAAAPE
jgi:hypothetical protein